MWIYKAICRTDSLKRIYTFFSVFKFSFSSSSLRYLKMYSENNNKESTSKLKHYQQKVNDGYMEDSEEKKKMKRRQTKRNYVAETDTIITSPELNKEQKNNSKKGEDLSRDDLLFLLSVLEGELQASI